MGELARKASGVKGIREVSPRNGPTYWTIRGDFITVPGFRKRYCRKLSPHYSLESAVRAIEFLREKHESYKLTAKSEAENEMLRYELSNLTASHRWGIAKPKPYPLRNYRYG